MRNLFLLFTLLSFSLTAAQSTPETYRLRRAAVRAQMGPNTRMILLTADVAVRNGDVEHDFRPDSDFWYLTGFGEPSAALMLTGEEVRFSIGEDNYQGHEFLFLKERHPLHERWTGRRLEVERAPEALGIDQSLSIAALTDALSHLLKGVDTVYVNLPGDELLQPIYSLAAKTLRWTQGRAGEKSKPSGLATKVLSPHKRLKAQVHKIQPGFHRLNFLSAGEILHPMRLRKSAGEIEIIQRAVDITGKGLEEAIRRAQPDLYEYQVQATIEYEFKDNGAQREGFPSIVASGPNSLVLHYTESSRQLQAGDLLLMDVGAEVDMYTADITRTVPVAGTFTPEQGELYSYLLEAQAAAAAALRPGVTIKDLNQAVGDLLKEKGYQQYLIHGVSHWLGMDVHDVGGSKDTPAEPGMVLTIEPGIYIPEDDENVPLAYRGLGLRLEDDFLVTEEGNVMLSRNIPRTIEEIESLMQK